VLSAPAAIDRKLHSLDCVCLNWRKSSWPLFTLYQTRYDEIETAFVSLHGVGAREVGSCYGSPDVAQEPADIRWFATFLRNFHLLGSC
jgi:hypothetical protein